MKKIVSILLILLLLASLSLTAFAQEDSTEPQLIVSTEKAMPGDEVSVTITIQNNPGIGVINPKFVFDSSRLEWLGYEEGGLKGWTVTKKAGVWLGNEDSHYDGVILTLRFKVLDTAPDGLAEVRLLCGDGDAYNYAEQLILFQLVSGGVQVGDQSLETSPMPETGEGSISPAETAAPLPSPEAESAPESEASAKNAEEQPALETLPAPEAAPSFPLEESAAPEISSEASPAAAAAEQTDPSARSFPMLPILLICCVLAVLAFFLIRKLRTSKAE